MAAPTIIQSATPTDPGALPAGFTITGVAAGSTLIFGARFLTGRFCYVSDDQGGHWGTLVKDGVSSTSGMGIGWCKDAPGGTTVITISANASATVTDVWYAELSACDIDKTTIYHRASNDTTNYMAETGGIDIPADSIVIAVGATSATSGTITADASYTQRQNDETAYGFICQTRSTSSLLTAERPSWTTVTSRNAGGLMASFRAIGSGGGSPTYSRGRVVNKGN